MRVQVTKEFDWAPDGNNVRTVRVGEVLEGRGAEVALKLGSGKAAGVRLPPLEEFVAAGYHAENYEAMVADETAHAKREGLPVEVRLPTLAETGLSREEFEARLVKIERTRHQLEAEKAAAEKAEAERLAREEAEKAAAVNPPPGLEAAAARFAESAPDAAPAPPSSSEPPPPAPTPAPPEHKKKRR